MGADMGEQNSYRKLNCQEGALALADARRVLSSAIGQSAGLLASLFKEHEDKEEISMLAVLDCIWPDKSTKEAGGEFRTFKKRLNEGLAKNNRPIRLAHRGGNSKMDKKTVWMEQQITAEEVADNEQEQETKDTVERIEQGQDFSSRKYPDTPAREFISPTATLNLPMVTFAKDLTRFAQGVAPKIWQALPEHDRIFFSHLGCKLEPIVQVVPAIPGGSPVIGMECLALGPEGESYGLIMKRAKACKIPWDLVLFLMALAIG
jgi:hypothetical protein